MIERSTKVIFTEIKNIFKIDDIDINKILVSKRQNTSLQKSPSKSFTYFLGYDDNDDIRPLCIRLPQMIGYVKCFDSNKTMSFKVIDKKLLKKYTKIW